jgi:hypothetical protein
MKKFILLPVVLAVAALISSGCWVQKTPPAGALVLGATAVAASMSMQI